MERLPDSHWLRSRGPQPRGWGREALAREDTALDLGRGCASQDRQEIKRSRLSNVFAAAACCALGVYGTPGVPGEQRYVCVCLFGRAFWPRLHACRASMVRPRPRSSTCSWAAAPFGGAALAPLVRGGCASLWRCVAWTVSCRCASMARLRISPRTAAPLGCCVAPAPWRLHPSGGAASEPLDPRTAAPPLGAASRPRLGGCTLRAVLRFLPCASCHAVLALRFQPCASSLALPALRFSDSLARLTSSGLRRGCRGVCCVVCVLCFGLALAHV
jgi:hypothetical protein